MGRKCMFTQIGEPKSGKSGLQNKVRPIKCQMAADIDQVCFPVLLVSTQN